MHETIINEPIMAQVRFLPGGHVQPTAFVWQGRTRYLAGLGRQWTTEDESGAWRCFLAQTANGDTVELRWHTATHEWRLFRAWWRENLV